MASPRLEVEIGAINKDLARVLADSEKRLAEFQKRVQNINLDFGSKNRVGHSAVNGMTKAIEDQIVATEKQRTKAAEYRAEIAKMNLENKKAKGSVDAANGSYRQAQQQLTALGKSIRESANGFNLNDKEVRNNIAEYARLNAQLKEFDRLMGNNYRNVGNYTGAISGMGNQLASAVGSYVSLISAAQGLRSVIRNNAELSDSIADIQRTAELSKDEARGLVDELKGLGTRTSIGELAEIAVIGGQLGIAKEELGGFTEAVDMLAVVLKNEIPGGAESVTEALGKINGVFRVAEAEGLTAGQAMQKTGSAILALGQAGLATGKFMVDFTQRVGGAARTVGVALPTVLAYGAVLEEAGVSAEVAGTAVSKLIGQLAVRRNEFFTIAKLADANLTIKEFTDLINTDADAALRKFFAGLQAGGKSTTQFYDILGRAKINTERYRNAVLLLSQDQEKLTELTALSTEEYEKGTKAAEQFELRNTTLGASLDKLSKSWQILTTSGNLADFFQAITDSITDTFNALNRLVNADGWEFLARASTITLLPGNFFGGAKISDLFGGLFSKDQVKEAENSASFIEQYAKMGEAAMKRLIDQQERVVQMRSDTYQDNKSRANLEELNHQAEVLAQMRMEYGRILLAKKESGEVTKNETKLTGEQSRAIENQLKFVENQEEAIRKLREQNHLNTLSGYEKELQQIKYRYSEEIRQAKSAFNQINREAAKAGVSGLPQSILDSQITNIITQRVAAIVKAIQDSGTLTPSLSMSRNIGRTPRERRASTAGQLNTGAGEVVQVELPNQVAKVSFDLSEITSGLKRASRQFINNLSNSLDWVQQTETKRFGDYLLAIGQSVFSSFDSIINNTLANQLESMLTNVFKSFNNKGEKIEWSQMGNIAAGISGQILQGITKRTNVAGQTVGGLLSGAAAGSSGGWVGMIVGAVVGGLSGLFSASAAKRQERLAEQQLEEQKKQTALMERQNALAYTSQIIGQMTNQGIVTGVERNEYGDITFRLQGQDLVGSVQRTDNANGRGL